ncbi:N-acetylglucosamine-6-phosphate deacetylase [Pedobacter psychrotolerans]|uniref:N-acetylglucosamine-6-phosphate deacetylase n=1 Tax=Pedobacter psychrotolerans TaxID=1843235 RepID=A0A4R2HBY4_9SPHI|nr:N-acetylglucosamine-6-phosphate deacetylase [Pedobacter psychrotolerans]TCO23914.1 N-acetylglucosamine-6-phosphate deacetylase [Pedobacter psychrotolerans]GGE63555.1 N-acetylglucosamine-6-phosphate deacetylase [Pedobacter psychrotolerans]
MLNIPNAKFYTNDGLQERKSITISNGKINSIEKSNSDAPEEFVVPGLIDLQIYGAGGKLFSAEPTVESLKIIEDDLLKKGTTGFLACMATNSPEVFSACIASAKEYRSSSRNLLGLHLEGPFLNPKRLGAHVPEFVKKASLDEIKALLDFGDGVIKMMTIAPEIHDDAVIQYLLDHDVVVSLGHSNATFAEATEAYNKGIQTTTHLFNAMSPIHHREPGIPTAFFNHDQAMASIIVDGKHLDFEVVKLAHKLAGDRLFLITDAVTSCTTGPYQHIEKDDKFVMPDGTLSGSSLTMLQAIKNCVSYCGINLAEAIKMASQYPAKLMGMENFTGKIEAGCHADLLLLDEHLNLKNVIFKGDLL